jgi:hypothetical protein
MPPSYTPEEWPNKRTANATKRYADATPMAVPVAAIFAPQTQQEGPLPHFLGFDTQPM